MQKNPEKDFEKIIKELKPNIEALANKYYISGFEKEDIYQESYIGVLSALKYFDKNKNNNFYAFANLIIERRIIMLLKKSKRLNSISLNSSVSLDSNLNSKSSNSFIDFLESDKNLLEDLRNENLLNEKKDKLFKVLSKMEKNVFKLYIKGYSYKEIANKLNKTEKSIDNAVQRIRKKGEKMDKLP